MSCTFQLFFHGIVPASHPPASDQTTNYLSIRSSAVSIQAREQDTSNTKQRVKVKGRNISHVLCCLCISLVTHKPKEDLSKSYSPILPLLHL
mmetsp:Transcript_10005/g.19075  ORF Transcript_10005/g.19075 Transcript_10005/m.19075 type:complete len:92 (+) Transcript_10005:1276-1551(+)